MKKVFLFLIVICFLDSSANATIITFNDGVSSGTGVNNFYQSFGMTSPNLRFHQSSLLNNEHFPFVDDWGTVIDAGRLGTITGFVDFVAPIDFLEIDAFLQDDPNLLDVVEWNLTAFDGLHNQVDFVSSGDIVAGGFFVPSTLRVEAVEQISSVEINRTRKIGFDTFRFEGSDLGGPNVVPEPATLALFTTGLLGAFVRRRFKS